MILEYWFSERCTRQIKLITCISTCLIIYLCSQKAELPTGFVVFALLIGTGLHLVHELMIKLNSQKHMQWLYLLPLTILVVLIYLLPPQHKILFIMQMIGFVAVGFFIVSIYSHRAQR